MKLKDKVAVVTGGSGGIGAAICRRYAEEGARVVVADRNGDSAQRLAAEIGKGSLAVALDVASRVSIGAMVDQVVATAGGIDILVNNAAVFDLAPILEITEQSYDTVFAVNVKGLLFTLQAAARQMVKQGRGGKIVNFASQAGRRGEALVGVYCASKAAVISLTQSAGLGLIEHKINVNGIAPGYIATEMNTALIENQEFNAWIEKRTPMGRWGAPAELGGAAVFLASEASSFVNGHILYVDGAFTATV